MRKTVLIATATAAAFALGGAGIAAASDDDGYRDDRLGLRVDAPRAEWMSIGDVAAKIESMGYTVREIEVDDGVYEVEGFDANGLKVEAYVHPVTGEILPRREGGR